MTNGTSMQQHELQSVEPDTLLDQTIKCPENHGDGQCQTETSGIQHQR